VKYVTVFKYPYCDVLHVNASPRASGERVNQVYDCTCVNHEYVNAIRQVLDKIDDSMASVQDALTTRGHVLFSGQAKR
jgi:hypothetical protein